jgi:hypothetical protein
MPAKILGRCKNCSFWSRLKLYKNFRVCEAPEEEDGDSHFTFAVTTDGHFDDDSSLTVNLMTGPEAGCSRFRSS